MDTPSHLRMWMLDAETNLNLKKIIIIVSVRDFNKSVFNLTIFKSIRTANMSSNTLFRSFYYIWDKD